MRSNETEFSAQAFRLVARHVAAAGVGGEDVGHSSQPSWLEFSLYLRRLAFPPLDRDDPPDWVAGLFAELGAFVVTNAAASADYHLGMMLKGLYPYARYPQTGLNEERYARLRGYIGVPLDAAEAVILGSFADEEWRESQMGY
jgi:hypothetical protein